MQFGSVNPRDQFNPRVAASRVLAKSNLHVCPGRTSLSPREENELSVAPSRRGANAPVSGRRAHVHARARARAKEENLGAFGSLSFFPRIFFLATGRLLRRRPRSSIARVATDVPPLVLFFFFFFNLTVAPIAKRLVSIYERSRAPGEPRARLGVEDLDSNADELARAESVGERSRAIARSNSRPRTRILFSVKIVLRLFYFHVFLTYVKILKKI